MAFKRGPRGVGYYEDAYEMKKVTREGRNKGDNGRERRQQGR